MSSYFYKGGSIALLTLSSLVALSSHAEANDYVDQTQYFQEQQQTVTTDSRQLNELINRITRLAKEGNFAQALEDVNQAIEISPENPKLYRIRAHLYLALKQYTHAIQDFNYIITTAPNDETLYIDRGMALLKSGNFRDAGKNAKQALQLNPNSNEAKDLLIQINKKMFKS